MVIKPTEGLGTTQEKKNGKKNDIMQLSVNPLPSYPNNDIFKSDKLVQPLTPSLLHEIMTNALINSVLIGYNLPFYEGHLHFFYKKPKVRGLGLILRNSWF